MSFFETLDQMFRRKSGSDKEYEPEVFAQILRNGHFDTGASYNPVMLAAGAVPGVNKIDKFGRRIGAEAGDDVWNGGGYYTGQPVGQAAETVTIASASTDDAAAGTGLRTCTIFGLDADWLLQSETITLNGTTDVESVGEYVRVFRLRGDTAGEDLFNQGEITITGSVSSAVYAVVPAGTNKTAICASTIPANKTGLITLASYSAGRTNGTDYAEMRLLTRPHEKAWETRDYLDVGINTGSEPVSLHIVLPPKTDFKAHIASVSASNMAITARIEFWWIDNEIFGLS